MFLNDSHFYKFPLDESKFNCGSEIVSPLFASVFAETEICNTRFN